jgi:hypothetical protein
MGVGFSSCSKNGGEKENEDAEKTEIGMMMLAALLFQAGTTIEFKADGTFLLQFERRI